ncbi:NAD-dependent epimerase/dehydratase family protein [Streptomyces sp. TRM68367]|uniref:NAD-dependent epimerase/dehydratase family protein n=1 Tax=Streptomyces sp. TRM68367 TaxID=2758415 RepID=UPI00165AB603|nr:NAD-dependent epimerase/dehydratase family protein [Streptomyces sp. TRM68367]MBC9727731.1 NAD-dependent epimerase/dehydratase family protein [Streptomyces sp. TRM68367]
MTVNLLITGATGFIGSRVAAAAHQRPDVNVRLMRRHTSPGDEALHGDLADPRSLRGVCADTDVLVHCASHIGGAAETAAAINDMGTMALVAEAVASGVRRIVYVSTASVLGRGPFRGVRPGEAPLAPASATSRTRAAAERHVLDAGGLVLRPHLVYGAGDRWVIPGLVGLLRELSATPTGCDALHSMIDVETLGRAVVAAALSQLSGVHHVDHPDPVPASELLAAVSGQVEDPGAGAAVDVATARARSAESPRALHHLDLLTVDHWFADDAFWKGIEDVGCTPGEGFAATFPRSAPWYRSFLEGQLGGRRD